MSNFNIALLVIFIVFAVVAVLIFSNVIDVGDKDGISGAQGTVVLWGTIDRQDIGGLLTDFNQENKNFSVSYVQKNPQTFDRELTEAFASGIGPDLFLLPNDLILRYRNKIFPIPYQSFSERVFRDMFVSEGELYLFPEGVLAVPLTVDPMVMYYNRSMLDSAGIAQPPLTWDEFYIIATLLTSKDDANNIVKSAVSFGGFKNVTHAKDILSMLLLQLGNPIVSKEGADLSSVLDLSFNLKTSPAEAVLSFYTDFSNPLEEAYSWNKSLPASRDAFISEDLAIYFGYASELFEMRERNPNLDFDITRMPQVKNATANITIGRMRAIAISKTSKNLITAFVVSTLLTGRNFAGELAAILSLPPVRRDLLVVRPTTSYLPVFYDGALYSRSWLDPSPQKTDEIFETMVEDIVSGRADAGRAVGDASDGIEILLRSR